MLGSPRRPLPAGLAWHVRDVYGVDYGSRSLEVGGPEGLVVAYVGERACKDGWTCSIRRHLDFKHERYAVAPTQAEAMRWAEWWAVPRIEALRAAARARDARLGLGGAFRHAGCGPTPATCYDSRPE